MKKIITIVFTLLFVAGYLLSPAALCAHARSAAEHAETYACILTNAYFYERESDDSGLFLLPQTYFVKILTTGIRFSYVQYLTDLPPYRAVYGYCKTAELTFVDFRPETPYLYWTIDVDYTMDVSSAVKVDSTLNTVRLTYVYYGEYTVGSSTFCYVQREGEFGYLPKTMDITYPLNREYSTSPPSHQTPPESSPGETPTLVFFSVITLIALGLLYFLFKPSKQE